MIFADTIVKVSDNRYEIVSDKVIYQITVLPVVVEALNTDHVGDDVPVHDIPKSSATGSMQEGFRIRDEDFEAEIEVDGKLIGKFTKGPREGEIGLLTI
jgi:hypothetical protein